MTVTALTPEEFAALKPKGRRDYIVNVFCEAQRIRSEATTSSPRRGTTQGSAFLWVSLYGKGAMNTQFRAEVKRGGRIIQNYRGTKNAWYFGSQNDVGIYDGLTAMCKYLTSMGIEAYVCDEWD